MPKREHDIERELREWFRGAGHVVVVGIGNPIRMDDFVGMKIVQDLRGKVDSDRVMLIEAETIPENYMQEIIDYKPTHVLIIDAAILNLKPGDARIVNIERLENSIVCSTHMLPLRMFCIHLEKMMGTTIALLLIEPGRTDFGEELTCDMENTAKKVVDALSKAILQLEA